MQYTEAHFNKSKRMKQVGMKYESCGAENKVTSRGLGKKVVPRLREFATSDQREPGGEIHAI